VFVATEMNELKWNETFNFI